MSDALLTNQPVTLQRLVCQSGSGTSVGVKYEMFTRFLTGTAPVGRRKNPKADDSALVGPAWNPGTDIRPSLEPPFDERGLDIRR